MGKYAKIIERINSGTLSRDDLYNMRQNVIAKVADGDKDAEEVLQILDRAAPAKLDRRYIFMGFCPGAQSDNSLLAEWVKTSTCRFDFVEDEVQLAKWNSILPGETIILKKSQEFGKTMRLYAFGKVRERIREHSAGAEYFSVDWTVPAEHIEVPMMGCFATVNPRDLSKVSDVMHADFWNWMGLSDATET